MTAPRESSGQKLRKRERRTLGLGASVVGVLSGAAQFLAVGSVAKGLRLLGISAIVVAVGALLILGVLRLLRSGRREVTLQLNVIFLAVGLSIGLGALGGFAGRALGVSTRTDPPGSPTALPPHPSAASASAPSSASSSSPTGCSHQLGEAGVVDVRIVAAPPDLTICPVLLNHGAMITGPFTVTGQFIGRPDLYRRIVIVNQGDPETCDAKGNRPTSGYFYARGFTLDQAGTWSFTDPLGYPEAVTLARNYSIVTAPAPSIYAIRNDRTVWDRTHADADYPGMAALPDDADILGTFRQPPGRYEGHGSPCRNS